MEQVPWWFAVVPLVLGAALAEIRAVFERRHRAHTEQALQGALFEHERRLRAADAAAERTRTVETFKRETLLALDDSVAEFVRTVVQVHLEAPSGLDRHDRWWRVHVTTAREVRRLLARVDDQTLVQLVRATLDAGNGIIHATNEHEHTMAMGLTQDNANDASDRIGELLRDLQAEPWPLGDGPVPGDARVEPASPR